MHVHCICNETTNGQDEVSACGDLFFVLSTFSEEIYLLYRTNSFSLKEGRGEAGRGREERGLCKDIAKHCMLELRIHSSCCL